MTCSMTYMGAQLRRVNYGNRSQRGRKLSRKTWLECQKTPKNEQTPTVTYGRGCCSIRKNVEMQALDPFGTQCLIKQQLA